MPLLSHVTMLYQNIALKGKLQVFDAGPQIETKNDALNEEGNERALCIIDILSMGYGLINSLTLIIQLK